MLHTYPHASGGIYTDTETSVFVPDDMQAAEHAVTVSVRFVGNLQWWSSPDAATVRRFVDESLAGTGYRRRGARTMLQSDINGQRYLYTVARQEAN